MDLKTLISIAKRAKIDSISNAANKLKKVEVAPQNQLAIGGLLNTSKVLSLTNEPSLANGLANVEINPTSIFSHTTSCLETFEPTHGQHIERRIACAAIIHKQPSSDTLKKVDVPPHDQLAIGPSLANVVLNSTSTYSPSCVAILKPSHEKQTMKRKARETVTAIGEQPSSDTIKEVDVPPENQLSTEGITQILMNTNKIPSSANVELNSTSTLSNKNLKCSLPLFLRKVLREELGEEDHHHSNEKLLITAVHAVLLESGFVVFEDHTINQRPTNSVTVSVVLYTFPEILAIRGDNHDGNGDKLVEGIVLDFKHIGNFVNVCPYLASCGPTNEHRVCLNGDRFSHAIESMWKNQNLESEERLVLERKIFKFWSIVKDGVIQPFITHLREKAGLQALTSIMNLPQELKVKILEAMTGVKIAKLCSTCKELRNLSDSNELWKQKYDEEFGGESEERMRTDWKSEFARKWALKRQNQTTSYSSYSPDYLFYSSSLPDCYKTDYRHNLSHSYADENRKRVREIYSPVGNDPVRNCYLPVYNPAQECYQPTIFEMLSSSGFKGPGDYLESAYPMTSKNFPWYLGR